MATPYVFLLLCMYNPLTSLNFWMMMLSDCDEEPLHLSNTSCIYNMHILSPICMQPCSSTDTLGVNQAWSEYRLPGCEYECTLKLWRCALVKKCQSSWRTLLTLKRSLLPLRVWKNVFLSCGLLLFLCLCTLQIIQIQKKQVFITPSLLFLLATYQPAARLECARQWRHCNKMCSKLAS